MNTVINIKNSNRIINFVTQQYEIGLYIALYEDGNSIPISQGGIDKEELKYHKSLRRKAIKNGDEIILERSSLI